MESPTSSEFSINTPTAIIIAGVIIAGAVLLSNGAKTNQTVATAPVQQPQVLAVDISTVKLDNEPFIGNANAPVTMAYWYDYQCPFCQRHEEQTMPQILKEYVDTGKLKIVYKDFQFLGPDSQMLGQYSRAVWEVAPGKFYQWHKAVYDNQGTENTGWATKEKILSITTSVLGTSDTAKVSQLVATKGAEYQKEMDADKTEGAAMGITGTPGTIVGKQLIQGAQPYEVFKSAIDAALTGI
ncbi:thioredoxin domain-containing protein [Candidatus Kaiserbacteria bacterium]|nr:thioredoxin domain-containing protein [Candidatus Kaiserbacteria bacterium]